MKESILTMRLGSIADAALLKAPLTADSQQLAASSCQSRYWICCEHCCKEIVEEPIFEKEKKLGETTPT
jgi:hypothetical protein